MPLQSSALALSRLRRLGFDCYWLSVVNARLHPLTSFPLGSEKGAEKSKRHQSNDSRFYDICALINEYSMKKMFGIVLLFRDLAWVFFANAWKIGPFFLP